MNFKAINSVWLWKNSSKESNQYATFTQKINLTDINSKLYISCDTNYAAYLNGKLVGFGQYLAYPSSKYYDILELKEAAIAGENILLIDVYYQGISSSCYAQGEPGLIYTIYSDGKYIPNTNVLCYKTPGYKEGEIPLITTQLGTSFEYNATELSEEPVPAEILEFSDSLPKSLRKRPIKKLITDSRTDFVIHSCGAFEIKTSSNNPADRISSAMSVKNKEQTVNSDEGIVINNDKTYIIIDLCGETTGYFKLELNSVENVRIDVGFGEHLIDGRVRSKIGERNFAFTYYTKKGDNSFINYFRRIGAKYLQLNFSNVTSPITLKYAGLIKAEYPVLEAPMPKLSDSLDKKIYKTCVKTLKCCMHEHYEDTPWREQSLYALDSRNQTMFGYSAFEDNSAFIKASIDLLGSSLREDGLIDLTAPSSGEKTIPSFTMAWLIWIAEYIQHTKDKSYLMIHENKIEKIIYKSEERIENGILYLPKSKRVWNFYDWAPGLDNINDKETDVIFNLYFCLALKKLLLVEKHFRKKELVLSIKRLYKQVKKAINKTFYNEKRRLYHTFIDEKEHFSKLAQALALCSGVARHKSSLRKKIITQDNLIDLTLSTKEFEYEALATDLKKYGDYILKDIREIWGKMVFEGADTFYETAKGAADFEGAGSLCHGWSAAPVYWYRILFG